MSKDLLCNLRIEFSSGVKKIFLVKKTILQLANLYVCLSLANNEMTPLLELKIINTYVIMSTICYLRIIRRM